MSSFSEEYRITKNSITALKNVKDCDNMSLDEIANKSFTHLESVFEEQDFFVSTENKRGILKNTGKFIGVIVSLGGSFMLEMHNKHYADMYEAIYKPEYDKLISVQARTNKCLSSIGEILTGINKLLKPISKVLNSRQYNNSSTQHSLKQITKFSNGISTSLNAGFGGLAGGTIALGAWGLVSLIGSASTGTAIASLSGVAATNATLAWFGGGSLAAGGAGMAGGFWVLGGMVAAPIVFFSTRNAYKKVEVLKEKKSELIDESNKVIQLRIEGQIQLLEAKNKERQLLDLVAEYAPIIKRELEIYKSHRSFWHDLFFCKMTEEQQKHYDNLNKLTSDFLRSLGFN